MEVNNAAMPRHPASELLGIKSHKISGKKLVLGITGSIAATETVKLTHELIRHGAAVFPVLTKAAANIISPEALKFASENEPVVKLTGDVEHVKFCGKVADNADLLLIAPSSANTISKIAAGIDDTTVTTFATTAIGSKIPIIIVPAMHASMYEHPIVQENIKKLEDPRLNIEFIHPKMIENKRKLASNETIVAKVIRKLWNRDLDNKKVLIIAGSTMERVDDMRLITNRSTGNTGLALADQAYLRGASVTLWLGNHSCPVPDYLEPEPFESVNDLSNKVTKLTNNKKSGYDIIIVCAAISDYTPQTPINGKLPSGKKSLSIDLSPTPKIIDIIRKKLPRSFLVGFKAESNLSEKKLIDKANERLSKLKLDMMVANDLTKVKPKTSEIFIIKPKKRNQKVKGSKSHLAESIFDEILK
jgi:phosphopantothenoylcysteine decarboxylase/phosphopantothenate--cysteine ligase